MRMLLPAVENELEDDGTVVRLVPGGVDERDRPGADFLLQVAEEIALLVEFRPVPPAELVPLGRVVPEPLAEFRAGGDLLEPQVDRRLLIADPSGPEPLNQDAQSILLGWRLIGPLQPDRRPAMGHAAVPLGPS